jgi:hypothetical protein
MKLTQNQYFGLKSEMPDILPEGSTFFATDEDRVYMYGEDSKGTIQDTPIPSIENDGTGEFKQEVKAGFLVTSQKRLGVWQTIQKASIDETFIRTAVKTGVGSFHLGEIHSIGSGGEDVVFVNEKTNLAWSPVWQGTSTDGLTVIKPSVRKDGTVQDIYPLGLTHTTGTIRDYVTGLSVAQNLKVFSVTFVPAENYSGKLNWRAMFDTDLIELSSFSQDVVLTAGTPYKFQFKYPLSLRTTSGISTSRIIKADETPLRVYAATNDTAKAWRKLSVAFFTDEEVLHTANPTVAARSLETLTGADRLDVLKLKNTEQLSTGGFVGGINFISDLTQFDNAVRNQYWQAQTEGDIGGVVFLVGDKLICVSNVSGTPPNLTDSTKWAVEKNLIGIATTTVVGTVKVGDGLKIDGGGKLDADLGVGLKLDDTKKIVPDVANIDVMSLKNAGLLNKGNYRGDVPTAMSGLTASLKGDWWKASTSKTLSGVSFASGDELYCVTDTPTLPATLANFAKVNANTAVMIGTNGILPGQSGSVPTPLATDRMKFLRGDAQWIDIASLQSKVILQKHNAAAKYDQDEIVEVLNKGVFRANNIIDGTSASVAFIEGSGVNQWTKVEAEPVVTGATATVVGKKGLVPVPAIGANNSVLYGDGAFRLPATKITTVAGSIGSSNQTVFAMDSKTQYLIVECQAGGGGGRYAQAMNPPAFSLSAGGAGGGYIKAVYTRAEILADYPAGSVVIQGGAGGTGRSIVLPVVGGTTYFGNMLYAYGGQPSGGTTGNNVACILAGPLGSSSAKTSSSGKVILSINGGKGGNAACMPSNAVYLSKGGDGGTAFLGAQAFSEAAVGGPSTIGISQDGKGYGAGGSGTFNCWASAHSAGGDGAPGIIIITEYM